MILLALALVTRASSNTLPAPLRDVGIDQRLNAQVPLDLVFRDETGRAVKLGEYFGSKPVILAPVFFECPMLCTQILGGLVSALKPINFDAGREFDIIAFSFDPQEGPANAAAKKESYLKRYRRAGAGKGFHFLTGGPASIAALTRAVGFRYSYDERTKQFAHASAVILLTPEGRVSRYFYGVEYGPRDLRLGLVEASRNRIGTVVDQAMLFCFHYDPALGRYTAAAIGALRVAGVATLAVLFGFLLLSWRRDAARKGSHAV